jgi:hypothetical protein
MKQNKKDNQKIRPKVLKLKILKFYIEKTSNNTNKIHILFVGFHTYYS